MFEFITNLFQKKKKCEFCKRKITNTKNMDKIDALCENMPSAYFCNTSCKDRWIDFELLDYKGRK